MRFGVVHELDGLVDGDTGDFCLIWGAAAYHQHDAKLAQGMRKTDEVVLQVMLKD